MRTWHVSLEFTTNDAYTDDAAFELIDTLAEQGAALSVADTHTSGTITITVDSATAINAAEEASRLLRDNAPANIGVVDIAGIEVQTIEAMDAHLNEPVFPEVVGYAEIAEMAGISRQRARQLAQTSAFPNAVITTAQGPLMSKHAVERWLETRNTKPGRPAKADA